MLPPGPIPRAFHATQELRGVITVRRVNALEGVSNIVTFKDRAEMRDVLSASYEPDDLDLHFHELDRAGAVIFYAASLELKD